MKKLLVVLIAVGICSSVSLGSYTHEITSGYDSGLTLQNSETLSMTGGGIGILTMYGSSEGMIEGTSSLQQSIGGVWHIRLANESHLDISGGEIHQLDFNNNATATLTNCLIESIYSTQVVPVLDNERRPHITLYHSGAVPTVQDIGGYDYLVGNWQNGDAFNIFLHDTGYDVYGNFNFIPEPATLALFAIGGLLIRRKK